MRRIISGVLAAVAVLAATVVAAPAAQAAESGLFRAAWDDSVYRCNDVGRYPYSHREMVPVSAEEWRRLGYPAVEVTPSSYRKVSWSPTIHASSQVCATYEKNGHPYIGAGKAVELTFTQWARAGYPTPNSWTPEFWSYASSPEVFSIDAANRTVKLTYGQWAAGGHPVPTLKAAGFARYAWSPRIFEVVDEDVWSTRQLRFVDWVDLAQPTPRVESSDLGAFVQYAGEAAIWFVDGETEFHLTFQEWAAAGYPTPEQVTDG